MTLPLKQFLLIDDSASDRFAIRRSVQRYSESLVSFEEVDSAAAALRALDQRSYDVIICDFYLRDMPGTELLQLLKTRLGALPCPVVMVTGSLDSDKLALRALEAGAHDYIEKSRLREPALWKAILYAASRYQLADDFARTTTRLTELNQELERKNRLKTEFLANATHELRTPVSAIIGLVGIIHSHESLPTEVRDHLTSITACCESLLHSVNDVLDLTKIESGEFVLEHSPFCPYKVCERVCRTFSYIASDKNTEIKLAIDERIPTMVGDGKRVQQILMNFVGNALKHTENGTIEVGLSFVPKDQSYHCRFEVHDTGVGIPEGELPYIFERHFQASNSSEQVASSGLGLAIVKELVSQMDGRVGCQSELGDGSQFWFEITLGKPVSRECSDIEQATKPSPRNARVLVAEDNLILGRVIKHQFEKLNCQATVVPTGEEAVAAFQAQSFDLVVLDARMPGMGGLEAARRMRQTTSTQVPIVLLTADSLLPSKDLEQYGITAAYLKPLSDQDLQLKILSLLA